MNAYETASVAGRAELAPQEDLAALSNLIQGPVDIAERVGAGRNSRVYRVRTGREEFAAKFYFRPTADGRDRSQVEFSALRFLWKRGMRCIPEPLKADSGRQVALYSFVRGDSVDATRVSSGDVGQLVDFVRELRAVGSDPEARSLGSAAEAFFSVAAIVANVRKRLTGLDALRGEGAAYRALEAFLAHEFSPAFEHLAARALSRAEGELAWENRTLSPSDLGFHNTLRESAGRLVFLDFEYFGWDDPAKTLSDCLLHPLMGLAPERRLQLVRGIDDIFGGDQGWRDRLERLYPLFALKWCMIMLNEFRPDQIERRRYVDQKAEEIQVIQMRQLDGARALLQRVMGERGGFPYWERSPS